MDDQQEGTAVLLIEDNKDDAELLVRDLARAGNMRFEIDRAEQLSEGIERLRARKYDIIFADLGLPDSVELDTFVKVHAAASDTPIVVLTGYDDDALALRAVNQGAQDYLVKGQISSKGLVRVIRYSIERQKLLVKLEKTLKEIKTLRELLPICAWCKNIRDDNGYWKNVEAYITEHTGTVFTHGICPSCVAKLREQYPDRFQGEIPHED